MLASENIDHAVSPASRVEAEKKATATIETVEATDERFRQTMCVLRDSVELLRQARQNLRKQCKAREAV